MSVTGLSPRRTRGRLWHNLDFLKLWAGQSTSQVGSRLTELALPLTGILMLGATPGQLGILTAAEYVPVLFVTMLAGVWADRHRRRPILLATNVGRAAILGVVPLLAVLGGLSMTVLYGVALSAGILTALFDVTYISYLPSLVEREDLVEGNSKLQSSQSLAQVAGQGAAGVLVQLVTAPGAILFDAISYVVAAVSIVSIRTPEPTPVRDTDRRSIRCDMAEGLRFALASRVLRPLMLQSAMFNLVNAVILVVLPVYALRTLHFQPATLGLVIACGSAGALAGAMGAARVGRRLGAGGAMALGMGAAAAGFLLLPAAAGSRAAVITLLIAAFCLYGAGLALFNVHSLSTRQRVVPTNMLGRVTASYRMLSYATIPLGGLLGGQAAGELGIRTTLMMAAIALTASAVLFARSGVARVHLECERAPLFPAKARAAV